MTFICGRAGVCALGAVVAKYMGYDQLLNYYLAQFKEVSVEPARLHFKLLVLIFKDDAFHFWKQIRLSKDLPDELLYGRAGFLWASLFINRHLGKETISPAEMVRQNFLSCLVMFIVHQTEAHFVILFQSAVVTEIFKNGRKLGGRGRSPLMFEWYGEKYWGAAHGLAGIMHVLMHFALKPDEREDVKETLNCMIKNRFPSGNYPASEEDKRRDVLVHWCHGARINACQGC